MKWVILVITCPFQNLRFVTFQIHHKQCQWCPRIGRCSNGLDRHRQEWLHNGCEAIHAQSLSECTNPEESSSATSSPLSPHSSDVNTFGMDASIQPYGEGVCTRVNERWLMGDGMLFPMRKWKSCWYENRGCTGKMEYVYVCVKCMFVWDKIESGM